MKYEPYQANWSHSAKSENLLRKLKDGYTLNVCCGKSRIGDVKVDLELYPDMKADLNRLPFKPMSFDTVICDPPFSYYSRFRWLYRLVKLTRKRLIISAPPMSIKFKDMARSAWIVEEVGSVALRFWFVYDRINHRIVA